MRCLLPHLFSIVNNSVLCNSDIFSEQPCKNNLIFYMKTAPNHAYVGCLYFCDKRGTVRLYTSLIQSCQINAKVEPAVQSTKQNLPRGY